MKKNFLIILIIGIILFSFLYLYVGVIKFTPIEILTFHFKNGMFKELFILRLERMLAAYLVGGLLAICGVFMQSIFKNPIADPYILGVASGAGMGVSIGMLIGAIFPFVIGFHINMLLAFIFAISSSLIALKFSKINGEIILSRLLLIGMALTFFEGAFIQLIFSINVMKNFSIYIWLMGSFSDANFSKIVILLVITIVVFIYFMFKHKDLDIMFLGDDIAYTTGVNVEKLKIIGIVIVSIAVAIIVAYFGIIGFVGMIVPHMIRTMVGAKTKKLLIYSLILGAIFVALADMVARTILMPSVLPVGAVIGIIGAPYFIILLLKNKRGNII